MEESNVASTYGIAKTDTALTVRSTNDSKQEASSRNRSKHLGYKRNNVYRTNLINERDKRLVYPNALTIVQIKSNYWPNLVIGSNSTAKHAFGRTITTVSSLDETTTNDEEYKKKFVFRWIEELLRTNKTSRTLAKQTETLGKYLNAASCNIFGSSIGRSAVKCFKSAETNDIVLIAILSLGTTRIPIDDEPRIKKFGELINELTVSIVNAKRVESLLRNNIRAAKRASNDNQTFGTHDTEINFNKETAIREIASTDIDGTLKKFVAFLNALEVRKFYSIRKNLRLKARMRDIEREQDERSQESAESTLYASDRQNDNLNNALLKERYRKLNEKVREENNSIFILTQQIEAMRKILFDVRRTLIETYNFLYQDWDATNQSCSTILQTLDAFAIATPAPVVNALENEQFVSDVLKSFEALRSINVLSLKLTEDTYVDTYENVLPESTRSYAWLTDGQTESNNLECGSFEATSIDCMKQIGSASNELEEAQRLLRANVRTMRDAIERTRKDFRTNNIENAPSNIRQMAISFYKVLQTISIIVRLRKRTNIDESYSPGKDRVNELLNEPNATVNTHAVETIVSNTINDYWQNDEANLGEQMNLRPFGSIVLLLRNTQDAFDVNCLHNFCDTVVERAMKKRYEESISDTIDRETSTTKASDQRIVEEIDRATRNEFTETWDGWERVSYRLKTREVDTDDSASKHKPKASERVRDWHYRPVDPFSVSLLAAKLTILDDRDETDAFRQTISKYSYLLSWLLELRLFAGKKNTESATSTSTRRRRTDDDRRTTNVANDETPNDVTSDDERRTNAMEIQRYLTRELENVDVEQEPGDSNELLPKETTVAMDWRSESSSSSGDYQNKTNDTESNDGDRANRISKRKRIDLDDIESTSIRRVRPRLMREDDFLTRRRNTRKLRLPVRNPDKGRTATSVATNRGVVDSSAVPDAANESSPRAAPKRRARNDAQSLIDDETAPAKRRKKYDINRYDEVTTDDDGDTDMTEFAENNIVAPAPLVDWNKLEMQANRDLSSVNIERIDREMEIENRTSAKLYNDIIRQLIEARELRTKEPSNV